MKTDSIAVRDAPAFSPRSPTGASPPHYRLLLDNSRLPLLTAPLHQLHSIAPFNLNGSAVQRSFMPVKPIRTKSNPSARPLKVPKVFQNFLKLSKGFFLTHHAPPLPVSDNNPMLST
jgi:hypothetical protein